MHISFLLKHCPSFLVTWDHFVNSNGLTWMENEVLYPQNGFTKDTRKHLHYHSSAMFPNSIPEQAPLPGRVKTHGGTANEDAHHRTRLLWQFVFEELNQDHKLFSLCPPALRCYDTFCTLGDAQVI